MDLRTLLEQMLRNDMWRRLLNNPMAQFGLSPRAYLGATLLPERIVPNNEYTEQAIRFKTMVANDGTRYSPVHKKRGVLSGFMTVVLSHSDIGSEFTAMDHDALIELLKQANGAAGNPATMQAQTTLIRWAERTLLWPLLEKNELMRWQAMVNAQVMRTGPGGYRETITYSNPTGHRVVAAGQWSSNAYDPYQDLSAMMTFMAAKGYTISRLVAGTPVVAKLLGNEKMRARVGRLNINLNPSAIIGLPGTLSRGVLNSVLAEDGFPPIEIYDQQYQTQTGSGFFFPRDVLFAAATSGRDETFVDLSGNPTTIQNTLGYLGIGRPAGASTPGRVENIESFSNKPPRIEGEAWQTSLPVLLEPEAMYAISGIS